MASGSSVQERVDSVAPQSNALIADYYAGAILEGSLKSTEAKILAFECPPETSAEAGTMRAFCTVLVESAGGLLAPYVLDEI